MSEPTSLRVRAISVIAAAVGFWVLAIGLVTVLAWGGFAILSYAPAYALAAFASWGLGGALAFGLLPRVSFKKDEITPGLAHTEHPRLHAFVRDVAMTAGASIPDALYVFHDANAFAGTRKTGFLGKRESVVGLGLPLLAMMTENEARAVLAHEMGHHVAGDVKLGPWVHRTRKAIAQAVDRLEGSSFWLHLPFVAYADFFLKTSVRISREQEVEADRLAAKVAGAPAAASALRKSDVVGPAWGAYFQSEVVPILAKGRLPHLLEGFERYWKAAQTPDTPAFAALEAALQAAKVSSEDDTHPPLAERVAALGDPAPLTDHAPPALCLLDDVHRVEERVMRDLLRDASTKLVPVAWDAIVDEVWMPFWREIVKEAPASALRNVTIAHLPKALDDWEPVAVATRRGPAVASPEAERRRVHRLLATWLVVKLADRGYTITAPPGLAVIAEKDGKTIQPFTVVNAMSKKMDQAAWTRLRVEHAID